MYKQTIVKTYFGKKMISFLLQLNEITPYIDGTLMYGVGKAWTDSIRELSEEYPGRLKAQDPSVPISESFPADNDIKLPMANPPPPREHELKPVARFWRTYLINS